LGAAAERSSAISIIVIGENVRLREQLDWLTNQATAFNRV
jgi:hypothetical protein